MPNIEHPLDPLTDRQRGIIEMALTGESYKQIAIDLGISYGYVRRMAHESYRKIGLTHRSNPLLDIANNVHAWEIEHATKGTSNRH